MNNTRDQFNSAKKTLKSKLNKSNSINNILTENTFTSGFNSNNNYLNTYNTLSSNYSKDREIETFKDNPGNPILVEKITSLLNKKGQQNNFKKLDNKKNENNKMNNQGNSNKNDDLSITNNNANLPNNELNSSEINTLKENALHNIKNNNKNEKNKDRNIIDSGNNGDNKSNNSYNEHKQAERIIITNDLSSNIEIQQPNEAEILTANDCKNTVNKGMNFVKDNKKQSNQALLDIKPHVNFFGTPNNSKKMDSINNSNILDLDKSQPLNWNLPQTKIDNVFINIATKPQNENYKINKNPTQGIQVNKKTNLNSFNKNNNLSGKKQLDPGRFISPPSSKKRLEEKLYNFTENKIQKTKLYSKNLIGEEKLKKPILTTSLQGSRQKDFITNKKNSKPVRFDFSRYSYKSQDLISLLDHNSSSKASRYNAILNDSASNSKEKNANNSENLYNDSYNTSTKNPLTMEISELNPMKDADFKSYINKNYDNNPALGKRNNSALALQQQSVNNSINKRTSAFSPTNGNSLEIIKENCLENYNSNNNNIYLISEASVDNPEKNLTLNRIKDDKTYDTCNSHSEYQHDEINVNKIIKEKIKSKSNNNIVLGNGNNAFGMKQEKVEKNKILRDVKSLSLITQKALVSKNSLNLCRDSIDNYQKTKFHLNSIACNNSRAAQALFIDDNSDMPIGVAKSQEPLVDHKNKKLLIKNENNINQSEGYIKSSQSNSINLINQNLSPNGIISEQERKQIINIININNNYNIGNFNLASYGNLNPLNNPNSTIKTGNNSNQKNYNTYTISQENSKSREKVSKENKRTNYEMSSTNSNNVSQAMNNINFSHVNLMKRNTDGGKKSNAKEFSSPDHGLNNGRNGFNKINNISNKNLISNIKKNNIIANKDSKETYGNTNDINESLLNQSNKNLNNSNTTLNHQNSFNLFTKQNSLVSNKMSTPNSKGNISTLPNTYSKNFVSTIKQPNKDNNESQINDNLNKSKDCNIPNTSKNCHSSNIFAYNSNSNSKHLMTDGKLKHLLKSCKKEEIQKNKFLKLSPANKNINK